MLAWGGFCALAFMACAARAQVMEIRADGSTVTYVGPVLLTSSGATQLGSSSLMRRHPIRDKTAILAAIREASARHDVSSHLVEAVAWQESRLRQDALSPKGARGVMQLMPATASGLGVDANNLSANTDGGATYLSQMMKRFDGDIVRSLAAYNAGPEAVERYGGVPPYRETRTFVSSILEHLSEFAMSPETP